MSSDSEWSDWSGANYVDWEDLQLQEDKVENPPEKTTDGKQVEDLPVTITDGGQVEDLPITITDGGQSEDLSVTTTDMGQVEDQLETTTDGGQGEVLPATTTDGGQVEDLPVTTTDGGQGEDIPATTTDGGQGEDLPATTTDGGQVEDQLETTTDGGQVEDQLETTTDDDQMQHSDTSYWDSDNERWDLSLLTIQKQMQNVRIGKIFESWTDSHHISLKKVNRLIKEPVFPDVTATTFDDYEDSDDHPAAICRTQKEGIYDSTTIEDREESMDISITRINEEVEFIDVDAETTDIIHSDTGKPNLLFRPSTSPMSQLINSDASSCIDEMESCISSSDEYKPSKKDLNDSDSNSGLISNNSSSDGFCEVISRRQKKKLQKRKALRTSATKDREQNDNTNKRPRKGHISKQASGSKDDNTERAIDKAKRISIMEIKRRNEERTIHTKRLDIILKSNGLKREHVPAHGNCFFEAVAKQAGENIDALTLRKQLCDHLQDNAKYYSDFLNDQNIFIEIDALRQPGEWSSRLSDALPLAISNILSIPVKIFTSNPDLPFINVVPTLSEYDINEELLLAYSSMPGFEHYDAVINRDCKVSSESEIEQLTEDMLTSNTAADITIDDDNADSESEGEQATPKKRYQQSDILLNSSEIMTPRKQVKYKSPKRKSLTRKRKSNTEHWARNIRKQKRQSGEAYKSATGKNVNARTLVDHSCTKCRFKCAQKITEDDRLKIFTTYWNLQSYERQRDFICSHVLEKDSKGSPSKKRKQVARTFTFHVNGKLEHICKDFFLKTLGIGKKVVDTALKKHQSSVTTPVTDRRGKKQPHNKTPDADLDAVREHIESFATVESHYTRKDTDRKYLSCELSIRKMYDLYRSTQKEHNLKHVSEKVYRRVFCEEYNISFHKPKKDQCETCNQYQQAEQSGSVDEAMKILYNEHQRKKDQGRREKENDKETAKKNKNVHVVTFDLEAVLPTPCSLVSQVYYKRKLSCYNLSIYSLGDHKGTCYLWNETEGQRGSCEVATCLHKYMKSLPPYVDHLCLYSDNCMGQNRNKYLSTALLYSVSNNNFIETIDHKYLETGHTQMECDSMHAAIEHAKQKTNIYIPSQWDTIIYMARRKNPYTVVPLKFQNFIDFKKMQKDFYNNFENNTVGEKVRWREIKHLQFRKNNPETIYYKYDFTETEFQIIRCKRSTRGRQKNIETEQKYAKRLEVSCAKKADLLSLCKSGIIPVDHHHFYENIPTNKTARDCLPEPDAEEEAKDSD